MWQTRPTKGPHSRVQPDKRADTLAKGDDNRTHAIAVDVAIAIGVATAAAVADADFNAIATATAITTPTHKQ